VRRAQVPPKPQPRAWSAEASRLAEQAPCQAWRPTPSNPRRFHGRATITVTLPPQRIW